MFVPLLLLAQPRQVGDSGLLVRLNQHIDDYVLQQNVTPLAELYAPDFVFSHGSGRVDNRASWLKSVAKGRFVKRLHDSVRVELHNTIAILRGKLSVEKKQADSLSRYWLRYVRVYRQTGTSRWQLISHITTAEFHLRD